MVWEKMRGGTTVPFAMCIMTRIARGVLSKSGRDTILATVHRTGLGGGVAGNISWRKGIRVEKSPSKNSIF